jgi:hypothetical protein
MNEEQFWQLLRRAHRNEAPAEIIAAVELEPGLVTRASEEIGRTILHNACYGGHIDLTSGLVDRQADVHQRCTGGQDALMYAAQKGHIPVMEFLLSRGADMTARRNDGRTALGLAACCNKLPACKFLISRGSDLMSKNNDGETALDLYGGIPVFIEDHRKQDCTELCALFAEGPHPSQVQRRRDVNWARRWPFMFVVVSCGFRPLPEQLLAGLSLVPLSELPRREYCLRVILCSDFLLRRIVSFL